MTGAEPMTPARSRRPRVLVLVMKLGVTTLPGVVLNRLIGRPVTILRESPRPFVNRVAYRVGASPVDFPGLDVLDTRDVYGDEHGAGTRTSNALWNENLARRLGSLFPGVEAPERKIAVLLRAFVDARCGEVALAATWARSALIQHSRVIVTGPLDRISVAYLSNVSPNVRPGLAVSIYQAIDLAGRFARRLMKRAAAPTPGARRRLPGFVADSVVIDAPVLFFPHKTISYGGLFLKNQFYVDKPDSPFHPARMMHVELEPIAPAWCSDELVSVYEQLGIRYCYLRTRRAASLIGAAARFAAGAWRAGAVHHVLASPRFAAIVFRQWRRFDAFRASLDRFQNARIALIGYEMLFPAPLSLALESRGIRTIATQERLLASTCYRNWNYILDTYLVASEYVARRIASDPGKSVGTLKPIGLVRGDLIHQFRDEARHGGADVRHDRIVEVLVFDFHSVRDHATNSRTLVNNWRSNRAFYEDILRLAKAFSGARFTIRSKNGDWQTMDEFADVVDAMNRQANIVIDRDDDRMLASYRLAARADAIIARHTSIADECMAAGKPTLICENLPNADRTVSHSWDYGGVDVFVRTFDELIERLGKIVSHGHYLDAAEVARLQSVVNNGPADGNVRARVAGELQRVCHATNGRG